ncbi:putative 7-carboxy-7-deazaguanine synthase QueE [Clostridium estertheticum]|uniref:putative 7-carboxy-7-deazaguanine synthase QueE n=1 Tax=Clostridium estertheticum TaxID=238834 RepID=UPI0013EE85B0|nr:putative 7-carboxy-7-deazaguanine synthase QueE [Clostridium estertheticum]MBZ9606863.1 putative 7-carboxy-7-deazaguanine synthase QueE [Clostridium estertheticum]
MKYKVVEKFISVNGEGPLSGQLVVFIRFAGCNLHCSYCDTTWANNENVRYDFMTPVEIYKYVKSTKIRNITLTGGEPLLQEGIIELLQTLSRDRSLHVEIETNGSVILDEFLSIENPPSFNMDYKLPSSNMEDKMTLNNFKYLSYKDTVKFVSGSMEDLQKAKFIIDKYELTSKTNVCISPVFGQIDLAEIVEFMKYNKMNGVNLQVQLHKIIWDPNKRGV